METVACALLVQACATGKRQACGMLPERRACAWNQARFGSLVLGLQSGNIGPWSGGWRKRKAAAQTALSL